MMNLWRVLKMIKELIEVWKMYSFKQKLRLLFIMLPLKATYYLLQPFVKLQNKVIDKYNELDDKYSEELYIEINR